MNVKKEIFKQFSSTRDAFAQALVDMAKDDTNIVALCADLKSSLKLDTFEQLCPKQFYEMGICEQNMASAACGMAKLGKIPFICSYAVFSPGRNWDQIRVGACYSNLPIKVVGGHAGLVTGPDGATHQALEDIAMMRVLPNMEVYVPSCPSEAYGITKYIAYTKKPTYLRLNRINQQEVYGVEEFTFKKATLIYEGNDCLICAMGVCVDISKKAAVELEKEGISCKVLGVHCIKPLDEKRIIQEAKHCGCVVSVEEHQIYGGLGSVISEVLSRHHPTIQEFVAVEDTFGQSGESDELLNLYGISVENVKEKVRRAIERKNKK
ncbi:MAG: transketolase family protein [Nanoarchaeota archaeon]|nr:transketolase family protein [Nanoarchaeota archaeon]